MSEQQFGVDKHQSQCYPRTAHRPQDVNGPACVDMSATVIVMVYTWLLGLKMRQGHESDNVSEAYLL